MGSAGVEPLILENEALSRILNKHYKKYKTKIKFIVSPEILTYKSCENGLAQKVLSLKISLISKTGVLSEKISNNDDSLQVFEIEEVKLRLLKKIESLI